jgi:hypothetical protein
VEWDTYLTSFHTYNYAGERPLSVWVEHTKMPAYHRINLYINNVYELTWRRKTVRSIRFEQYQVVFPFGRRINLLDSDISLDSYRSLRDLEEDEEDEKDRGKLQWAGLECTDGKRVLSFGGIRYGDGVQLQSLVEDIPDLASKFWLVYVFTVVWEDGVKERHSGIFRFGRTKYTTGITI